MKVLIVVDMQNDFVTGALGTPEAFAILPKVQAKIEDRANKNWKIVFTQDTHHDSSYLKSNEGKHLPVPHCIMGTEGHEIAHGIKPPYHARYISKGTFGYLDWSHYLAAFDSVYDKDADEIELVGVCTDICVVSNAMILKAAYPEANITVDASCCAGTTPEAHDAALKVMKSCQINVIGA